MAQCQAITKDGKPCEISVPEGEKYCHIHLRDQPWQRFLSKRFWQRSLTTSIVVIVLSLLANVTGLLSFFGISPVQPPATATIRPEIPTNTPKPCIEIPVVIPTNMPNTAPLAIVPPLPNYCDDVMNLASYLAGNAVKSIEQEALGEPDKDRLNLIFRGRALEMAKSLAIITQLAILYSDSQDMLFELDPLSSKITKIELLDSKSVNLEVCMIISGKDRNASELATPYLQYALIEMQIQKIGQEWYVMDIPNMTAPNSC